MSGNGRSGRSFLPLMAGLCLFLLGLSVRAGQVRCPVCGEVFDDKVPVCPNDGTRLALDGRKEPDSGDADGEQPSSTDSGIEGETTSDDAVEEEEEAASRRYRRHDIGGARRRTDAPAEEEDTGRLDRLRRLQDGRAGWVNPELAEAERRRQEEERFRRKDAQLRRRYAAQQTIREAELQRARVSMAVAREARRRQQWEAWRAGRTPVVSMGVRLSFMGEGAHAGPVTGSEVDVNFIRSTVRVGLSSFAGVRRLADRGDLLFVESVTLGVTYSFRWSPFLLARFGMGALLSERFGEDTMHLVRAMGFEAGFDCRAGAHAIITPAIGYTRYSIADAGWDSVSLKISVGF